MSTGLGRNSKLIVGNLKKYGDWGNCNIRRLGKQKLLPMLSTSITTNPTYTDSAVLNGKRASKSSTLTGLEKTGSIPVEFIPENGIEFLLEAGLKSWHTGTTDAVASTKIDIAISPGDTEIAVDDSTGITSGSYIEIVDSATGQDSEVFRVQSVDGDTLTLGASITPYRYEVKYAKPSGTVVRTVVAPFTHNYTLDENTNLDSINLDKYLDNIFGERFLGAMVNTITFEGSVDSFITGNFDIIAKDVKKLIPEEVAAIKTSTITSYSAGTLTDSGASFDDSYIGKLVVNTDDGLQAYVVSVTSGTVLVLDNDIFTAGLEAYKIYDNDWFLNATELAEVTPAQDTNYTYAKSTITVDGSEFECVLKDTLTINNNITGGKCKGSGLELSRATTGLATIEYNFDLVYSNSGIYDKLLSGTTIEIQSEYEHANSNYSMSLHIPEFKIKSAPFEVGEGELQTTVTGSCEYDSGDEYFFKLSITDTTANYYIEHSKNEV